MSTDIKALMEGKSQHWTQEATCREDARFTGRFEWLNSADLNAMTYMCRNCPVFAECEDWAAQEQVIEVFAAGYWRSPNG